MSGYTPSTDTSDIESKLEDLKWQLNKSSRIASKQNTIMIVLTIILAIFTVIIAAFGVIEIWDKFLR